MQLTNQQMQAALDYCEKKVEGGGIWICLKFEDYCQCYLGYSYNHPDYREFEQQVQKFLNAEFLTIHGRTSSVDGYLDAESCFDPSGQRVGNREIPVKELRLRMITWLREQYPVE